MKVAETGFASSGGITAHDHRGSGLHEFHYFLAGEGTFWNGGVPYPIGPGSLCFSRPDEVHRGGATVPEGRFQFYFLLFTLQPESTFLSQALAERFAPRAAVQVGLGHAPVFEDIRRRSTGADPLVKASADFRFQALVCDLVGDTSPGLGRPASRYVDEALALMQASIHTGLDLNSLAERLGIDKSYFVRLFTRAVGTSPMRYFLGLRLDTAKHRLRNGEESLRSIALDLGFHDEFHFSHQFKAFVGQGPQAYRRAVN